MAEAATIDQREEKLLKIRHSTAHVMAEAVLQIFPGTKIAIGMVGKYAFSRRTVSREEAMKVFSDQPYKLELIRELSQEEEISVYTQDTFTDLCRGPHVENTGELRSNAFKLLSIAGAYWRGHERNPMLTRIYGTAWEDRKQLAEYLNRRVEIEKRDHRRLGKDLDLYSTHEEAGAGLIYWHPKGALIRHLVEDYWKREHFKHGYDVINTPHIGKAWLWQTSGHLDFYKENMYAPLTIDDVDFYLKPMNCPFHIMIYKSSLRSYRELPLRWAELGTVYRYERSGVLHGLLQVRGFIQEYAHIICTPEQIEEEIHSTLRFSLDIWKAFGFEDIKAYLATQPQEKSVGESERWDQATDSLKKAIDREALDYELDKGGGAFYGPKIDLKIKDSLGREWQMTTIQFDFNLPDRFDMTYAAADGSLQRPYMVHRALLGSLERFFGVLIEHYGGAFPVWLAPEQAVVIPVAPAFNQYAEEVAQVLRGKDIRVSTDLSDQRMNAKIRNAQNHKVPFMVILGEKERSSGNISLRTRSGDQIPELSIEKFLTMFHDD
jgi:threonyl-tRNA synthetase